MSAIMIVTGASRGLGLAVARGLAKRGARVLFTGRDLTTVELHAEEARRAGLDAVAAALDVSSQESVQSFARSLDKKDRIEALVLNAGIALAGFDASIARQTIDTNFYGALYTTDALGKRLAPGARVVMVSSGMGEVSCLGESLREAFLRPSLDRESLRALVERFVKDVEAGVHEKNGWPSSAYRVSKVAMNALTRILARELPEARVNAVCPGWVRTDLGGRSATRSVQEGAESILWAATLGPTGPTGGFFRDGHAIPW